MGPCNALQSRLRRLTFALVVAAFVAVPAQARPRNIAHPPPPVAAVPPVDIFSAATPEVRTRHLVLDLEVDFDSSTVRGSVTHHIVPSPAAKQFTVDTRDLAIEGVTVDGVPVIWTLGSTSADGQALRIPVKPSSSEVRITYRTSPASTALRWRTAKATTGRVAPAVWVQGQPDHTRSWIPLQDTPGIRMTWEATLRVPPGLLALMSAPTNPTTANDSGIYRFSMQRAVPPYLIVLAVGRFAFRALDWRTGVYAEPELLDDTAYEMQFLPRMFDTAERILGRYPFDRYDLLFAPGFGGGMENANLNFIGPDAITGNRPVPVAAHPVIAHELAHSWFGDMITCATWSDTWLNEGFATYWEKRILEEMEGEERAELGFAFDRNAYHDYAQGAAPVPMHRTFGSKERPGQAFNVVSYQKGGLFLKMLEDSLGRAAFDAFIRRYLVDFAFDWVDDKRFLQALQPTLDASGVTAETLRLDEWLYAPQEPQNVTAPATSRIWDRVAVQATAFRNGRNASQLDTRGWAALERGLFLQMITDILPDRLREVDSAFRLSSLHTPPMGFLIAIVRAWDEPLLPLVEAYLMRGTNNALALWQELGRTSRGRAFGRSLFERAREFYDANMQVNIEYALGLRISSNGANATPMKSVQPPLRNAA